MRAILLSAILALMLLVPAALADRGEEGRTKAEAARAEHRENEHDDDDDHDDDKERAAHRMNKTERQAWRANWTANRTAAWDAFHANVTGLRASWKENATEIREACKAAELPENATKEDRRDYAHCIRDGYREWRLLHADELRELHEMLKELVRGAGKWHKHGHDG